MPKRKGPIPFCVMCHGVPVPSKYCASCRPAVLRVNRKIEYYSAREANIASAVGWARSNKDRRREIVRAWRQRNPDRSRLWCRLYDYRRRRLPWVGDTGFSVSEWTNMLKRFGYRCAYCKQQAKLTADHVVPLSRGGSIGIENIVPACQPCNSRKGSQIIVGVAS